MRCVHDPVYSYPRLLRASVVHSQRFSAIFGSDPALLHADTFPTGIRYAPLSFSSRSFGGTQAKMMFAAPFRGPGAPSSTSGFINRYNGVDDIGPADRFLRSSDLCFKL
jgi:hypothetical protein